MSLPRLITKNATMEILYNNSKNYPLGHSDAKTKLYAKYLNHLQIIASQKNLNC